MARKFKYEIEYKASCDLWFVKENGVIIKQFDDEGSAHRWVQQIENDRLER